MTNIFNKLPETDRLMAGNFNEKEFWSAQDMQCTRRLKTKNVNDSRQFIKFIKFKCSLNFPGLQ